MKISFNSSGGYGLGNSIEESLTRRLRDSGNLSKKEAAKEITDRLTLSSSESSSSSALSNAELGSDATISSLSSQANSLANLISEGESLSSSILSFQTEIETIGYTTAEATSDLDDQIASFNSDLGEYGSGTLNSGTVDADAISSASQQSFSANTVDNPNRTAYDAVESKLGELKGQLASISVQLGGRVSALQQDKVEDQVAETQTKAANRAPTFSSAAEAEDFATNQLIPDLKKLAGDLNISQGGPHNFLVLEKVEQLLS